MVSLQFLGMLFALFLQQHVPQDLTRLTVPADRLPQDCVLAPSASQDLGGGKVRGGMWAGLRIPTNPWVGGDAFTVAHIRERMASPRRSADGPPLANSERARAQLRLAEGVEAAYAAVYADADDQLVVVYALAFADDRPDDRKLATRVVGPDGKCRDAVESFLREAVR